MKQKNIIQIALSLVIIILIFFVYESIMKPVRFDKMKNKRDKVVVERLKDIRKAQASYRAVYGKYTASFDTLINFLQNGQFPVVKMVGDKDTLSLEEALKRKLIVRDSSFVSVKDSIFAGKSLGYIDSLRYIPFSNGQFFKMSAGEIEKSMVKVQVIEVSATKDQFLKGLDEEYFGRAQDRMFGSMTEPTTDGNWE